MLTAASGQETSLPPLTLSETNRLVAALAVIAPRTNAIMPHSNLGILLADAKTKEHAAGGLTATTIPLYERVAHALTNAHVRPATNTIK